MLAFGGKIKNSASPIGVAVTSKEVRLAQYTSSGYVFESEPMSGDLEVTAPNFHAETQRAIATALRRGKFAGRSSVSALPAELLRYKTLRLPPMPEEDMAQAVAWEAAERFQLTADQSLQYYRAGQVNQGNEKREEVILLAAEKNAIYDHAMALKQAGLQPIAIDASAAALARLLGISSEQSTLTIHLGRHVAEIVGHRGDQVIFDKPIELTYQGQSIDIAALAREVGLCARYLSVTFAMHRPDAAWIAGHGATPAFASQLSSALPIEFKPANLAAESNAANLPGSEPAQWCVALGLSMRNCKGLAQRGAA